MFVGYFVTLCFCVIIIYSSCNAHNFLMYTYVWVDSSSFDFCSSLCPTTEDPVCEAYESLVPVSVSSCCTKSECQCDITKCEVGVTKCPSNMHVQVVRVNNCCEKATCVCNVCEEPCECKEGYMVEETTNECGCIKRTLVILSVQRYLHALKLWGSRAVKLGSE